MKFVEICIARAKITGLNKKPFYFEHRVDWRLNIMFEETSTLLFHNLAFIPMEYSEEEANKTYEKLVSKFKMAEIYNNDEVAVIFNNKDGEVLAIGAHGKDQWIDVKDNFKFKKFSNLNIIPTMLKVYV